MELGERLAHFIKEQERAESVEIRDLERITTGASRETWLFTAMIIKQGQTLETAMVLRQDPKAGLSYSSRLEEFTVLKKAYDHRIPVPKPLYYSEDYMERPFLIMERVLGETYPKRLLNDENYARTRGQWAARLGEILALIHKIPVTEELGFLRKASVAEQIERNEGIWRATKLNDSPVLEFAFRWLKRNIPQEHPYCFIHADFRMGNIMFDEHGVKCILDWELAQIGDPMYDISIMCMKSWRFDRPENRVGGFGKEEDFFEAYQRAGGFPIDRERIRYWEILANIFWAIVTVAQSRFFIEQPRGNLEFAKLGRRTSECEVELVELLKEVE
jgi:aminoglycoside phosphotransferase (APT) family kinase protein